MAIRRVHDGDELRHATWLELFFDLVFVVAVSRLGVLLHDDHSLAGVLTAAGLFVPVWWTWISFSYYADLFDDDSPLDRLAQLAAMLGAAAIAVTLTGGVGEDANLFAGTFAALFLLLAGLYALSARAEPRARDLARWFTAGSLAGASLWALSLLVPAPGKYLVWAAAVVVNAAISGPVAYARARAVPQQVSHMPERFGLFTIVVLGEAVLAVVNGLAATSWNPAAVATVVAGFVVAASVWWVYFDQFDDAAIDRARRGGRTAQVRSFAYGYGHLVVYAAIVGFGVAVELSAEAAAEGEAAVPLLGAALAVLIGGFVIISSGIGRHGAPAVLLAKAALAVLGLVATAAGIPAVTATVLVGLGWAALVVLEWRLPRVSRTDPQGSGTAAAAEPAV